MVAQFAQAAPHRGRSATPTGAPNAALLIDFDNVTMGIRSDLSKELKTLLNSDVIKGKVAVHRAYADWRRYPQYIVPLSEASVDLIFAPAYGSSKKNATDIRLAIDALELVFTRPEIGTFILLSGDSDFSSLVLKLKEYGKYVIGVGMRESRSDLLVQNCDEYYSYSALTGLKKATGEGPPPSEDPWLLVERAVQKMNKRNDVMRSDRLKQVMLELDPNFDEKQWGYKKFNKFISEAANRKRVELHKLGNGQYEIAPHKKSGDGGGRSSSSGRSRSGRRGDDSRGGGQKRGGGEQRKTLDLSEGYDLLRRAVDDLGGSDSPVRDSEVKRRLLELQRGWSESDFGLSKFSHFLRKAHNAEVIDLHKADDGIYEVVLPDAAGDRSDAEDRPDDARARRDAGARDRTAAAEDASGQPDASAGGDADADSRTDRDDGRGRERRGPRGNLLYRRGTRGRGGAPEEPPPVFSGQTISLDGEGEQSSAADSSGSAPDGKTFAAELGLPTSAGAVERYIVNSYKGVGKKTAESLIDAFGADNVFRALQHESDRVRDVVGEGKRVSGLLEAWQADYERRASGGGRSRQGPRGDDAATGGGEDGGGTGGRRGGHSRTGQRKAPAGGG